jgi:GTPase
MESNES